MATHEHYLLVDSVQKVCDMTLSEHEHALAVTVSSLVQTSSSVSAAAALTADATTAEVGGDHVPTARTAAAAAAGLCYCSNWHTFLCCFQCFF